MTDSRFPTSCADMERGTLEVDGRIARWWFTDRAGGESRSPYDAANIAAHVGDDPACVRANRSRAEAAFGVGVWSWPGPVHGTAIAQLDGPCSLTPDVDALTTTRTNVPLATLGADCVPLLLAADGRIVAAHIGWRGFVDGMFDALTSLITRDGAALHGVRVVLGPAICGTCYSVDDERAERIAQVAPEAIVGTRGSFAADLRVGIAAQWRSIGASVEMVGPCTFESARHFSHRRDGVTGRQAGVIAWTN